MSTLCASAADDLLTSCAFTAHAPNDSHTFSACRLGNENKICLSYLVRVTAHNGMVRRIPNGPEDSSPQWQKTVIFKQERKESESESLVSIAVLLTVTMQEEKLIAKINISQHFQEMLKGNTFVAVSFFSVYLFL